MDRNKFIYFADDYNLKTESLVVLIKMNFILPTEM